MPLHLDSVSRRRFLQGSSVLALTAATLVGRETSRLEVGTAWQVNTQPSSTSSSSRALLTYIVHADVYDQFADLFVQAFQQLAQQVVHPQFVITCFTDAQDGGGGRVEGIWIVLQQFNM